MYNLFHPAKKERKKPDKHTKVEKNYEENGRGGKQAKRLYKLNFIKYFGSKFF